MSLKKKALRKGIKKARKSAQDRLDELGRQVASAPKACTNCGEPFDNKTCDLDAWRITIYEDGGRILTCGDCATT